MCEEIPTFLAVYPYFEPKLFFRKKKLTCQLDLKRNSLSGDPFSFLRGTNKYRETT